MKREQSNLSIRIKGESALFDRMRCFLAAFFGVLFWMFYWLDCISWDKTVSLEKQLIQAFAEKGLLAAHFFEMGEETTAYFLCAVVGTLIVFLLFSILGRRKFLIVLLTGGLALLCSLRTGWMLGMASLLCLFLCWLILFVPSFKAGVMLAGGAALLLISLSFGIKGDFDDWAGLQEPWEQWRYNQDESVLPEGRLNEAERQTRGDEEALSIQMEEPSVYYLRGFTGTVFDQNAWSNRQGIFPQYWQADGRNHLAEMAGKYEGILKNSLLIQNTGASRRYLYLPYEHTTAATSFEEEKKAVYGPGDNYYAPGLTGAKEYQCMSWECMANALGEEETTQMPSDEGQTSDEQRMNQEEISYHEYVNTTCLMLTKEEKETISRLLGKKEANAGVSALSVLREIRKWMEENLEYVTEPGAIPEGQSFVRWFLEEEKKGFDVQYATAAVMFFRYYGIPSRYVEGYLVTQEAVSGQNGTGAISVKEKDAHAWAEIYLEETGWIPVEVLEEYEDKMGISYLEALDTPAVGQGNQTQDEEAPSAQNATEASDSTVKENDEAYNNIEETQNHTGKKKLWLLFPVLIAAVLVSLFFVQRQKQIQEERRWKESEDYGFCVTMYYRKLLLLIRHRLAKERKQNKSLPDLSRKDTLLRILQGLDPELDREAFEECYRIRQKAIYGNTPLTIEERDTACAFLEQEIKKMKNNKKNT